MNRIVLICVSVCIALALTWFSSAGLCHASEDEVVALFDDFSDGNITQSPAWQAGDLHWYNPFFVEEVDGHFWAGSRRYGSMGTYFSRPDDRGWPIFLDARKAPIQLTLTALFNVTEGKDRLTAAMIGLDGRIVVAYYPSGRLLFTFRPADESQQAFQDWHTVPAAKPGEPVQIAITLGGAERVAFSMNGQPPITLTSAKYEQVDPLLTHFNRVAFMGANHVQEQDIQLLVPELQDAKGLRWITDVEVRGTPADTKTLLNDFPPVAKQSGRVLLYYGVGAVGTHPAESLRHQGYDVTVVLDHDRLTGKDLSAFLSHLEPQTLCTYEAIVLLDIHPHALGPIGCEAIRRFVETGGKLLVAGGGVMLNRAGYFGSPLGELLPVTGEDRLDAVARIPGENAYAYQYEVTPRPDAKKLDGPAVLWARAYGNGWVYVMPQSVLGQPEQTFVGHPDWLWLPRNDANATR